MKVLKKSILFMVICVTMLSLCACGGKEKNEIKGKEDTINQVTKKAKNVDTFVGVFMTSGKDNESQKVIDEKKIITVEIDKEKGNFTVDGLKGIGMVATYFGEGEDRYFTQLFADGNRFGTLEKNAHVYGDEIDDVTIKIGTLIYVDIEKDEYVYANPMFRKSNGEIYIKRADEPCKVLRSEHSPLGNNMKIELSDEEDIYMSTAEFVTSGVAEFETEYTIGFVNRKPAEKVVIKAFDKDDKVIKKFEYEPDKVPEKIALIKDVKYYELEEHVKYEDRGAVIYRTQIDDLDDGYDNSGYYNGKEEIFLLESYVEIGEDSEE